MKTRNTSKDPKEAVNPNCLQKNNILEETGGNFWPSREVGLQLVGFVFYPESRVGASNR